VSQSGWDDVKAFLQSNPITRDLNLSEKDFLYFSYSGYHCAQGRKDYTRPIYYPLDTRMFLLTDYDSRANTIEEILNAFPEDQFIIISHSLGGVVSLYWAGSRLLSPIPQPIDRVKSIITLDSPLTGRPGPCGVDLPVIPQSVVDVLPKALDRVSVFTIRNIYDRHVKPEEATLPGVWRDLEGNFGGANFVNPCDPEAHGTVLQNTVVASEIAAAVWPAHIIGPSTRNPFPAGSNTQPVEINVTVTWPRSNELAEQLSNKQTDNLGVTIGGRSAQVLDVKDLVPTLRAFRLRILPPPQTTGGKYDLTVSIGTELDTQVQSVEMTGPLPGPSPVGETATAFVTDISGSMGDMWRGGIKVESAKTAATQFVNMLERESRVGNLTHQAALAVFSTDASLILPLTTNYNQLRDAIAALGVIDMTNIGAGLTVANNELANAPLDAKRIIILLSDGKTNTGLSRDEILAGPVKDAVDAGTCIYTVGFGDPGDLDENLLQRIAQATGCGQYYYAPDAFKLEDVYVLLRHKSAGKNVQEFSGQVAQGQTTPPEQIAVPPKQGELHVTLNWPGSRLDLLLSDPQGRRVDNTYPGASLFTDEPPVYAIVRNPLVGTWQAQVYGADVPEGTTAYNLVASTRGTPPTPPSPPVGGGSVWTPVRPGGLGPALVLLTLLAGIGAAPPPPPPVPFGTLQVTTPGQPPRMVPLGRLPFTIGRQAGCDLLLSDSQISRVHARISLQDGTFILEDLGSTNGTFVNGQRVHHHVLRSGDEIQIGQTRLRLNPAEVISPRY